LYSLLTDLRWIKLFKKQRNGNKNRTYEKKSKSQSPFSPSIQLIGSRIFAVSRHLTHCFRLSVTAEALREKIDWNSAFLNRGGTVSAKLSGKGTSPAHHFCTVRLASECRTALSLTVFAQRNFVADFLPRKYNFSSKWRLRFFSPFGELRSNVQCSSS